MKQIYTLIIFLSLQTVLFAQQWEWANAVGGTGTDLGKSVSVDPDGNVYVAGDFTSPTLQFGQTTLVNTSFATDIFLAKYDPNGNVLWAVQANGSAHDYVRGLKTDVLGNAYVTGYYGSSSLTFGNQTIQNSGSPNGDLYLAKYDPNGNILWVRNSEGSSNSDGARAVETVATAGAVIGGPFQSSSITFDTIVLNNVSAPDQDGYIAAIDSTGDVDWAMRYGGNEHDRTNGLSADAAGNIYAVGVFESNQMSFSGSTLTNAGNGTYDMFLSKFDNSGNVQWVHRFGGIGHDHANSVDADLFGYVYVAGYFESQTIDFGNITLTNPTFPDANQFLIKCRVSDGEVVWAKTVSNTTGDNSIQSVVSHKNAFVYTTGYFEGATIDFGNSSLTNASPNQKQVFVAEYDTLGNLNWVKGVSGTSDDIGNSVDIDNIQSIYVTGQFQSASCQFESHAIINSNAGVDDVFVAKIQTSVGIIDYSQSDFISLYPNPTTSTITLQTETPLNQAWLTDLTGRRLMPLLPNVTQWKADLSALPHGMYLVEVFTEEGKRGVRKVVRE